MPIEESKTSVNEVPGVGTLRARAGTSVAELAGAVSFWHKKAETAWKDGFLTCLLCSVVAASGYAAFQLLTK